MKVWGSIDRLDQAGGEIISQPDAGEIMDLLMQSDSFGSDTSNLSVNCSKRERLLEEVERDGGMNQDVMGEGVSNSCSL